MSEIKVKTIEPSTGTNLTLGTSGDTIAVSSDAIKLDIWKDSGGNTLFQSDGAGTLSNVNSGIAGGGPQLILSQSAVNSASITFTANIDSTYDHYMFVWVSIHPSADTVKFQFQASTDAGSNYNINMTTMVFASDNREDDTAGSLQYEGGDIQQDGTSYQNLTLALASDDDSCTSGILHLYNPSSTTYVKNFYATSNELHNNDGINHTFAGGILNTTSAINAVSFKVSSGNLDVGKIKMYGVV